jgi:hypothetical protein
VTALHKDRKLIIRQVILNLKEQQNIMILFFNGVIPHRNECIDTYIQGRG